MSLFCLSSCKNDEKTALRLNGVKISNDVYTYFLDEAISSSKEEISYEKAQKEAVKSAKAYFKKNTLAHKTGVKLTVAQKKAVSERVNASWSIYGDYYTSIGVTKETLTKVYTADAYRDSLLLHYYGEGGENEISLARLYASFRTNYIVFQCINGYLSYSDAEGFTRDFDDAGREAVILRFQNMASLINAGEKTMEDAAEFLSLSGYSCSVSTVVLKKGNNSYPAGFFEKVQSLKARDATVIGTTEHKYIFLVIRGDAGTDSEYFLDKKEEIVKEIAGTEIDERIEKAYSVSETVSVGESQSFYNMIKGKRESK